jgi:hypothetical protein
MNMSAANDYEDRNSPMKATFGPLGVGVHLV